MPITALPAQTVRAIGSSQVLPDSFSLVKELLDNAIDGQATSISVEISVNTLDLVRVKDNGYGINPDDRPMICRRHCTSKIRNFDELRTIGGRSLGFRGVALASVAEMSGRLTISTRIEGEETASEMSFNRQGQIAGEKRTSLPAGTNVRVERFLEPVPIRRQAAEKISTRTLVKIKKMVQAYALARPYLGVSLKVIKAKDEKANWKYPLSSSAGSPLLKTLSFASVTDIIGKKITNQCQWACSTWSSSGDQLIDITSETSEVNTSKDCPYRFEAVLAKDHCDASVINNVGQFLSVDARPVSCTKGTLKQIVSKYKSYLRSGIATAAKTRVTDPFFCMNIVCPLGSYDANIEPAKDDVLFTDADLVIRLAENFFKSVYGELNSMTANTDGTENPPKLRNVELLLAKKNPSIELKRASATMSARPASPPHAKVVNKAPSRETKFTWGTSMYDENRNDVDEIQGSPTQSVVDGIAEEEDDPRNIQVSNPWVFAKLNAPSRKQMQAPEPNIHHQLPTPARQIGDSHRSTVPLSDGSRSLDLSSPTFLTPPRSLHQSGPQSSSSSPPSFPFPLRARGKRNANDMIERLTPSNAESDARGALDAWVQKSSISDKQSCDLSSDGEYEIQASGPADVTRPSPFVSARTLPRGTPVSEIPVVSERPRRRALAKTQQHRVTEESYVAPVNDPQKVWFDVGEKPKRKQIQQRKVWPQRQQQQDPASLILREDEDGDAILSSPIESQATSMHSDLAAALDYEARKQLATQQHRELLRRQAKQIAAERSNVLTTSPHKNRQRAAIAALHTEDGPSYTSEESSILEPDDPRAYLIRTRHLGQTSGHRKFKRTKTSLLPFETIQQTDYIGHLIQTIRTKTLNFNNIISTYGPHDEYIHQGIISEAFSATKTTSREISKWEKTLKEMVKAQYRIVGMAPEEEMEGELECDLGNILRKHMAEYAS